ncbi:MULTISPECIES: hypothetical protein [Halobacterium]|uniref:Vng6159h n=3 Tax=Halobacterium salinarum TaxID=2242 RepID=Q9HHZ2_HALSA|nr:MULTISPECIES: hypothetical protein [Halobacterium]AAG20830.1 Vng6159h [Halobacterium salinarum NRC-1]MBB6090658.1 Trk-type K+ transport system membrane component [Halobacterium salinarum]MDL0120006.1 hypothetical protein [Halobacterium salinarum]MDL0122272.1 hypothetical protein [Halobacterium salinarum]MDL0131591.1 hypothetical protein [Halobacterium salinarum]
MADLSQIMWLGTMVVAFLVVAGFYYTLVREGGAFLKSLRSKVR